jgi:Alpha-glutamyl/putrescinyl thymine pyrophosphorylase clade 3
MRLRLSRSICPRRADPSDAMFDPELAAELFRRRGDRDEAIWLAFLVTHFGKHPLNGWSRVAFIYRGDVHGHWTWRRTKEHVEDFRSWLEGVEAVVPGGFSNHRKYESLGARNTNGTGSVVADFIRFVGPGARPSERFDGLVREGGNDPHAIFDLLYRKFDVHRFGRLAKIDLFTLLEKLQLAPLVPGRAYFRGATGPSRGAKLLFVNDRDAALSPDDLQDRLNLLDYNLPVGMHIWEDAICNWQKSPDLFQHFRG